MATITTWFNLHQSYPFMAYLTDVMLFGLFMAVAYLVETITISLNDLKNYK